MRLLILCVLGAVACNGSGDNMAVPAADLRGQCPTNGAPAANVTVVDDQYQPQAVTVPVCGKVRWTFQAAGKHGVYPWDMNFPASPIMSQGVFEYVFPAAGTYSYGCAIHGRMMPGSVTVR
jgi:plastocyanin